MHLVNRLSSGCVNLVEANTVRGHRNADPRNKAAPPSATTALRWTQVAEAAGAAAASPAGCERPTRMRFAFTDTSRGAAAHLHIGADGALGVVSSRGCGAGGGAACTFELVPVAGPDGDGTSDSVLTSASRPRLTWFHLRSVLTGRHLKLHHTEMPEAPSWLGLHPPRASRKPRPPAFKPRSAMVLAKGNGQQQQCPVRSRAGAPPGWAYNTTLWAPLIDAYLAPWSEGNISATMLDMAFWKGLYGEERAHAIPGVHVSSTRGRLMYRENVDYRMKLITDMLATVHRMVALPEVEFVAHLWDHPKVDRQTPLPIFAHYADASHRDIPMPAPWSWDEKLHAFPQPWIKLRGGACATPWSGRDERLYFRGGCNGPTRGWRGPLWPFYPRKRSNRLSASSSGAIDAGVYDHCDSPKLSPLEWAWDAQMEREMGQHATKKRVEPFGKNCEHRYILHIDGNVASSRLASELFVGSTILKQDSFSSEYFYPLLRPWVHYVPVATNLRDVPAKLQWAKEHPRKAEAIAKAGADFAREHLHTASIACYWWQLLTAFAELQDFAPRSARELGFRVLQ